MMFLNKSLVQNVLILLSVVAFLTFGFAPIVESAQTRKPTKPTPTPTKKKTTPTPSKATKTAVTTKPKVTPTPKTTPKPKVTSTPKATPKPKVTSTPKVSATPMATTAKEFSQLIVIAAGARIRSKATTSSAELGRAKLGSLIKVLEKTKKDWYRIEIPNKSKNTIAWMSGQVADDWDTAKREDIYRRIVERNYKAQGMSFGDASELFEFLAKSQNELRTSRLLPDFSLKELVVLRQTLRAIPFGKDNANPYKSFLTANEKHLVYSEPAGEWFMRSDFIWNLQRRFSDAPIAEDIAWIGAENPLPGECEGYVNCYLFQLRERESKYLELYPNGKRSLEALKNIQNQLDPIVADLSEKKVYNGPTDISDRAEFNRLLSEIRTIVSQLFVAEFEKQKTIQQLNQIAEGFR